MKKFWAPIVGLLVGLAFSVCAGFVQADRMTVQQHKVYFGVPLAVGIMVGLLMWLNRLMQSRLPGFGVLLAWVVTTWQFTAETPSGDIGLVPATNSNAYLIAGSLCLGIAAAAPILRPLHSQTFEQTYQHLTHWNENE